MLLEQYLSKGVGGYQPALKQLDKSRRYAYLVPRYICKVITTGCFFPIGHSVMLP